MPPAAARNNLNLEWIFEWLVIQITMLVFVEHINDMRIICRIYARQVLRDVSVSCCRNWSGPISSVAASLFPVGLNLRRGVDARQDLLVVAAVAAAAAQGDEAVVGAALGGRGIVGSRPTHRNKVWTVAAGNSGKFGDLNDRRWADHGAAVVVGPVAGSCRPPVGNGAADGSTQQGGHRVQHRPQVNIGPSNVLGLGYKCVGYPAHHRPKQSISEGTRAVLFRGLIINLCIILTDSIILPIDASIISSRAGFGWLRQLRWSSDLGRGGRHVYIILDLLTGFGWSVIRSVV